MKAIIVKTGELVRVVKLMPYQYKEIRKDDQPGRVLSADEIDVVDKED